MFLWTWYFDERHKFITSLIAPEGAVATQAGWQWIHDFILYSSAVLCYIISNFKLIGDFCVH